jgi:hypothetical protein
LLNNEWGNIPGFGNGANGLFDHAELPGGVSVGDVQIAALVPESAVEEDAVRVALRNPAFLLDGSRARIPASGWERRERMDASPLLAPASMMVRTG